MNGKNGWLALTAATALALGITLSGTLESQAQDVTSPPAWGNQAGPGFGPGGGGFGPGRGRGWGGGRGGGMGPGMMGMGPNCPNWQQGGQTGQGGWTPGQGMGGNCPFGGAGRGNPAALSGNLEILKSQLAITPQQETAWQGYARAVNDQQQVRTDLWSGTPTATTRSVEAAVDQRLAAMNRMHQSRTATLEAYKALYQQLDERQKGVADQQLATTCRRIGPGG